MAAAATPIKATPVRIIETVMRMKILAEVDGDVRVHELFGGEAIGNSFFSGVASGMISDIGYKEGQVPDEYIWKAFERDPGILILLNYLERPEVHKAIAFLALDIKVQYYRVLGNTRILLQILDPERYDAALRPLVMQFRKVVESGSSPDSSRLLGILDGSGENVLQLHRRILPALLDDGMEYETIPVEFRPVVENMIDDAQMRMVYGTALKIKTDQFAAEGLPNPEEVARKYLRVAAIEYVLRTEDTSEIRYEPGFKNLLVAYQEYLSPEPETPEEKPAYRALVSGTSVNLLTPEEDAFMDQFRDLYEGFDNDVGEFEHPEELFASPGLARLRSGEIVLVNGVRYYIPGLIERAWERTSLRQKEKFRLDEIRSPH